MGKENLVIVRIWEGLGNQLFQYAYARALKERGINVRLDLDKAYDDTFAKKENHARRQNGIQNFNISIDGIDVEKYGKYRYIQRDDFRKRMIFNLAKHGLWKYKFCEQDGYYFDKKYAFIKGNCYIKGWFQDPKYFRHIRSELLEELTPKKKIVISKELRQALESRESVAVHVRRGDYVKIRRTSSISYYKRAVKRMKEQYQNPFFLFFSDDIEWVKENLNIEESCLYVNEDHRMQDYEELLIMSKCKSIIMSNSTFSWWGAWLNRNPEKIIIVPRDCWLMKQKGMIYV